jgi:hypothetical protein
MVTRQHRKLTERQLAKLEARVTKGLLRSVAETFIATGEIDPSGKSEAELELAVVLALADVFTKQKGGMDWVIDHRSSLLQQGREFARRGKAELAIVFYATWFEHWINSLLNRGGHHLGLRPKDIQLCLRYTGLEAKFVCFPLLLKFPRLAASHIATVRECSRLRNAFVHYKFPVTPMDEERKDLQKALRASEKTVRYLCNYEDLHVFKRAKKWVKKLVQKSNKRAV